MRNRLLELWSRIRSAVEESGVLERLLGRDGGHPWWRVWERDPALEAEGYRRLTVRLHHSLPRGEASRSILVVTPTESDEAATASMGVARSLADELHRPVLLVEASKEGDLTRLMGNAPDEGLTDFLATPDRTLSEIVVPTSHDHVSFLARGGMNGDGSATWPEDEHALIRAASEWDFVVVSGGGVLTNTLSLSLAPHVGQVLLLVSEGHTHLQDIDAAQSTLRLAKARNVSIVLTEQSGTFPK